jgi:hypothetical protein
MAAIQKRDGGVFLTRNALARDRVQGRSPQILYSDYSVVGRGLVAKNRTAKP